MLAATASASDPGRLVIWAPGYPGSSEQAATAMADFAAALAEASDGLERVETLYEPSRERGLELLADRGTVAAIVPAPVLWRYRAELGLAPLLKIVPAGGEDESWSLVARAGAVSTAAGLADWEIHGLACIAPDFVRGPVLGSWGELPASTAIVFTSTVRSSLRRAAAGEKVAVLLDRAQRDALPALPFAGELEIVARSPALPSSFFCEVGGRLGEQRSERLRAAALRLTDLDRGREALAALRIARMVRLDTERGPAR